MTPQCAADVPDDRSDPARRSAGAEALLRPLAAQVPGLASALDDELTARHIEQTLLEPGGHVHRVTPGALWYRPDGSCSFRYRVAVSAGTAEVTEHTILARVYPSDEVAGRCLTGEVLGWCPGRPAVSVASVDDNTRCASE